jgi:hypothetical protein
MTEIVSEIGIESRGISNEDVDNLLRCFEEDGINTFNSSSFQNNSFEALSSEEEISVNESTGSNKKRKM